MMMCVLLAVINILREHITSIFRVGDVNDTLLQNVDTTYKTTWNHNPQDHKRHLHCKNVKSQKEKERVENLTCKEHCAEHAK
jgi:hypothetical protein